MTNNTDKIKGQWRRRLLPLGLLIIGLAIGFGAGTVFYAGSRRQQIQPIAQTSQELYNAAVRDAVFADEDEIMPLVSLTKEDSRVTWNQTADRVLLLTWHNYPDSYPKGETVTLTWGPVWTFTDGEILAKYASEADKTADWNLRLKQIIGFPPDSEHTTITGIWVRPEDVCRPAYQPDPTKGEMDTSFNLKEYVDPEFKAWFDGNIIWSYFDSAYPWTRLGYTYDWADNGTKYGLSEFLVKQDAQVEVAFTEDTDTFLKQLADGTVNQ